MEECMTCGVTKHLIEYSKLRDGTPIFLCFNHTPINRLEKEIQIG